MAYTPEIRPLSPNHLDAFRQGLQVGRLVNGALGWVPDDIRKGFATVTQSHSTVREWASRPNIHTFVLVGERTLDRSDTRLTPIGLGRVMLNVPIPNTDTVGNIGEYWLGGVHTIDDRRYAGACK